MASFLFGFAAALLLTIGARDQLLVARLSRPLGAPILFAAILSAIFTAGLMAMLGDMIAQIMPAAARHMLVAIALVVAAFELSWPTREKRPKEPTHSPFAAFVVLLLRQWGDAARFLLFALAAATTLPALVAAGGALGAAFALAGGWALGDELDALPLRPFRLAMGAIVLIAGMGLGLGARGIL
ncbi:TMEM165/GDT1 family protein [Alteriqipengyuania sp. 357]